MKILGLDPGKTTGWGLIDVDCRKITLTDYGSTKDMTLVTLREWFELADVIVYESWRTRPKKAKEGAFNWGTMPAPEVIGAVKTLRSIANPGSVLAVQEPAVKPVGYAWAQMKYVPGKQGMHIEDAIAHAVYYAVNKLQAVPLSVSGKLSGDESVQ